jgi:octaprenyl-diphosphate synthase
MELSLARPTPAGLHGAEGLRGAGPPDRRPRTTPLARCLALVGPEMANAEVYLGELLADTVPAVARIGQFLNAAGGKRLRPLLTALGARAAANTGDIARLMCAGEILHLGSLLHDDVVDGAVERRGSPAAHTVFGNAGVILTGDVCLARAVRLAAEEGGHRAVLQLTRVVARMSEGEVLQLLHRGRLDLPRATYMDIIERKSAELISWCAAAGAWASGNEAAADALVTYGRAVGIAFQITDDVIDYIGVQAKTGKLPGRDLAERKLTLPLLCAMDQDPGLADALAAPASGEDTALLERIIASGGPQRALKIAEHHVADGVQAIEQGLPPSAHRAALVSLAHHLVHRLR